MFKNVASQKISVFAFDTTTGAAKTGDAANITVYVNKEWAGVNALTDASATEIDSTNAKGWYLFDVSQTETNADALLFTGKSSTANISVVGQLIYSMPPNFTTASIDSNGRVDVIKVAGTTQTARDIGTSVLLSAGTGTGQLDFTSGVVKANATQWLGGTIPAVNVTGVPLVDLKYTLGTISPATAGSVRADAVTGAVGSVTGLTASNLDAAISSRMASYTQPTGFLAATFPGSVASPTNITAGTITTATNVTTVNGLAANVITATSIAADAITAAKVADGTIDRATFAADTGLQPIRSSTAQAGSATTITLDASASASNNFYNNDIVYITGGTGVGQARFITAYVGATKVATVATWVTNPDNTSTFAILPFDAVAGASAPTAAQVATAVWQDTTAGDFTTAGSIGKSLFTSGAVPGASGGLFIAGTNAATAVAITGNITGNLSGSVGSVTGLTASDVGAIKTQTDKFVFTVTNQVDANVKSNAGAAITSASGIQEVKVASIAANAITSTSIAADAITDAKVASDVTIASVTGSVGSVAGNVGGNVVGSVASVTAGVTLAASAVQAIWDALTSALTTAGSIGKLLVDNINATISSRLATAGYTTPLDAAGTRSAVGLGSATLDTQLAAIQADTDNLQTRVPAALVGGRMDASVGAVNADTVAAANLAKTTRATVRGTVTSGATTTSIPTSVFAPAGAAADQFKGMIVKFDADTATTSLRSQSTDITASSNSATPTLTVTALTTAPAAGDTFSIQ